MRFAFSARLPVRKHTCAEAFQWGIKREPRPINSNNMEFYRYERMMWRSGVKPNRLAVGVIRAMGAKYFFNGCHIGAEND